MAASAVTVTVVADDATRPLRTIVLTVAIGAGDYAAGGLAGLGAAILAAIPGQSSIASIVQTYVKGVSGYYYEYVLSTGKLQIRTGAAGGTPLTELAAAPTPAGAVADVITMIAWAKKYQ